MEQRMQKATIGGGCFWCLEAVFERLQGVEKVVSGYAGGDAPDPSYDEVCSGKTGHAEVVQITFDPSEISYRDILDIFFTMHDPTTPNRQGPDVGSQYRSVILYHDGEQERVAKEVIAVFEQSDVWDDPIVTEIVPLEEFYRAEEHHQEYYRDHSWQPYCQAVIAPKIAKLRQKHLDRLKAEAQ